MHQHNDFATSYNGKDQGQMSHVRVEAVSKNIGNVVWLQRYFINDGLFLNHRLTRGLICQNQYQLLKER